MNDGTGVPKIDPLTEEEFHNALVADWNRLEKLWGRARLALNLGLTTKQLGKIMAGLSLHPQPHRIFNLLTKDDAAVREILDRYGLRAVPKDAVCSSDPGTLHLAVLLQQVAQAEHPESPGGVAITEHEARAIPEENLLAVERVIHNIRAKRKPRAVA